MPQDVLVSDHGKRLIEIFDSLNMLFSGWVFLYSSSMMIFESPTILILFDVSVVKSCKPMLKVTNSTLLLDLVPSHRE